MELAPEAIAVKLPSLPRGWYPVAYAALSDGRLAVLGANADLSAEFRTDETGRTLGDPQGVAAAADAALWTFDGAAFLEGPRFPLLTPYPVVDRLKDGRWVVASARTLEGPNMRVLSPAGREQRRIHVGDGIMHLKADDADNVWVGWFDEGVFGNPDWHVPGHDWPPSGYGLAAFNLQGDIVTHAVPPHPETAIADCYALNVISEMAFACTYPDFPIVTISTRTQTWSSSGLSGQRALAIDLPYVLAVGGYASEGDKAVLLMVDRGQLRPLKQWRMPALLGFPQSVSFVDGRRETIHMVQDQVWHRWKIDAFLTEFRTR